MSGEKLYWAGRSSSNDLGRDDEFRKLIMESILETKASTIPGAYADRAAVRSWSVWSKIRSAPDVEK